MDEQLFSQQHAGPANASLNAGALGAMPQISPAAQITNLATRLKLAEERYANLSKRNQLTESGLLAFEKDIKAELRAITKQTVELRKHISEINAKMDLMVGELSTVVKKHEFTAVERYLDLWQPMRFVTLEQARRMIEDAKNQNDAPEKE